MKNKFVKALSTGVFFAATALTHNVHAGLIYDESVSGDSTAWFSGGGISLGTVSNDDYILGTMENVGSSSFWEGYSFILDGSIDSIKFEAFAAILSNDWQVYLGLGSGSMIDNIALNTANKRDLLDVTGLTGLYTLGNNINTTSQPYDYKITFIDADASTSNAIPEPSTLAIFALGMIGLASRRFKKQ